jgi:hypothetical protein
MERYNRRNKEGQKVAVLKREGVALLSVARGQGE